MNGQANFADPVDDMWLLDTCTLLWLVADQEKLSPTAEHILSSAQDSFFVSAVSGFEIAQKVGKGKLLLPLSPSEWVASALDLHVLNELDLDMNSALAAGMLPALHADPFDRLLIATAQNLSLTLLTPDPLIRQYPGLLSCW